MITATGDDPFGRYAHRELRRLGVDDRYVGTVSGLNTPVTFCEIFPPDDFPLYFYRTPIAPDLVLTDEHLDLDAIHHARIYWSTVTGLSQEPSRATHHMAWKARERAPLTILDLDYRPMFWSSPERGDRRSVTGARTRSPSPSATAKSARSPSERPIRIEPPMRCSSVASNSRSSSRDPRESSPRRATRPSRSRRIRWKSSTGSAQVTGSAARSATDCCRDGRSNASCASPTSPAPSSRRARVLHRDALDRRGRSDPRGGGP